jgi:signal transduction histidine kinase
MGKLISWINQKIQRRLLIWSIGFWVVSVSILSLSIFWIGQNEITTETRQRNIQMASVISRDINSEISSIFADTRTFARYLENASPDLKEQAASLLALRLSAPQRYLAIYYFDMKGKLLLHLDDTQDQLTLIKDPTEIADRPSIPVDKAVTDTFNGTGGSITYISEVGFTGLENIPVTYIGVPIMFNNGETRVAVFETDLSDIWRLIDLSTIGQSGYTYAVSKEGTIIAHPERASIGRLLPPEINPLLQGYEGFTEYIEPTRNRPVIAAYSPVGGPAGWGIVVIQDQSEAFAPIIRTGVFIIAIWLGLALIGTVGILLMIRSFTRPIIELTRTTQAIAQTGDLTRTAMVKKPDEVGQMSQAFDQMIERLQKSEVRLAHAAAEERNRLARDLHDAVSQTLFSATLIADVLPRLWDRNQPEARKRLEELRQLTRGALAEMRTLLLELRPSSLLEAEMGYLLKQLGESITGRSRIPVTVTIDGDCLMPDEVKVALYRIAQESLNNVAKHAGAQNAAVNLVCRPTEATLKIVDDGHGFDVAACSNKSLGLGIIRERAKEIGASLTLDSHVGEGTEITVVWKNPVPPG